jgi:hypothetical protein
MKRRSAREDTFVTADDLQGALLSPKDLYRQRKEYKEEWLTNFPDAVVAIQHRVCAVTASRPLEYLLQPRNSPLSEFLWSAPPEQPSTPTSFRSVLVPSGYDQT